MKLIGKKTMAGILAGTVLFTGGMYAAPALAKEAPPVAAVEAPPELTQADKDEIVNDCVKRYGVKESDVREALKARRNPEDIYYAALLSKASGKSLHEIITAKADWREVERKFGITESQIDKVVNDMIATDIAERSGLAVDTVKDLLKNHYHPRDIRIAGRLAKESGKDVRDVLDMKKLNMRWRDVADKLHLDVEVLKAKIGAEVQEDAEAVEAIEDGAGKEARAK